MSRTIPERDLSAFPWPLEGYDNPEPLSKEKTEDGKSLLNPDPTTQSATYTSFPDPISNTRRGGFDIHIYFLQTDPAETKFAHALHERIRRDFPEFRIYSVFEKPVGPHPVGMFEVNLFTPAQFGAFIPWLVVHRGPLSCLVHPNTGRHEWDHTVGATWIGQPYPLQTWMLRAIDEKEAAEKAAQTNGTSSSSS